MSINRNLCYNNEKLSFSSHYEKFGNWQLAGIQKNTQSLYHTLFFIRRWLKTYKL